MRKKIRFTRNYRARDTTLEREAHHQAIEGKDHEFKKGDIIEVDDLGQGHYQAIDPNIFFELAEHDEKRVPFEEVK